MANITVGITSDGPIEDKRALAHGVASGIQAEWLHGGLTRNDGEDIDSIKVVFDGEEVEVQL